ncbi:GTP cyclohydrolase II [Streptomyces tremellae]|uniref:GTP cyclohydrolase-2 n=1 Tax=Streptomyces tremellae TaxID=1124239 RepID=A0ABP7G3W8_9ACTN
MSTYRETVPTAAVAVRARVTVALERFGGVAVQLVTFTGIPDGGEHVALVVPPPPSAAQAPVPLVRLHSECLTGDIFGSTRCDCGPQLDEALRRMAVEGGVLLYLRQEGRGIGLYNKLDAYVLQDRGNDTFEANRLLGRGEDERDYTSAAAMLQALGLEQIRVLTNNPDKVRQLRRHGITVREAIPTRVHLTADNARYLQAKAAYGGHTLDLDKTTGLHGASATQRSA